MRFRLMFRGASSITDRYPNCEPLPISGSPNPRSAIGSGSNENALDTSVSSVQLWVPSCIEAKEISSDLWGGDTSTWECLVVFPSKSSPHDMEACLKTPCWPLVHSMQDTDLRRKLL